MSYDIYLIDPATKKTLTVDEPHALSGGTYAVGGTQECWLNVTYNYSPHFHRTLGKDGIRSIYGMTGAAAIDPLSKAINALGDDVDSNYWKPTEGNAKRALTNLLKLAEMHPDGVFAGD